MSAHSQFALAVAVGLVSATIGYWVGVGSNLKYTNVTPRPSPSTSTKGDESDEDAGGDGNLGDVKAGLLEECKLVSELSFEWRLLPQFTNIPQQVLVVRTDLGMSSGKIAAQCG
ncbi:hypothetical protein FRC07_000221, partial [Ceratobasidium sp. 392]